VSRMSKTLEPEVLDADEAVDAKPVRKAEHAPEPQLDPDEPEDGAGDEGDDGEEEWYAVIHITGHVTYHRDTREPWQVEADWKLAKAFAILPNSGGKGPSLSDEEVEYLDQLQKEDPKRFQKKDAKVHAFTLGDRVFNPEHIVSVGPALDMIQPSEEEIMGPEEPDSDDQGPSQPPSHPKSQGSGRDRLRAHFGGGGARN